MDTITIILLSIYVCTTYGDIKKNYPSIKLLTIDCSRNVWE